MRNPESIGGGWHRYEGGPERNVEREDKAGLRLFRHTPLLSPTNAPKVLETSVAALSRECVDAAAAAKEFVTFESTLETVIANAAFLDRSALHHLIVSFLEAPETFSAVLKAIKQLPEGTVTADMVMHAQNQGNRRPC